jgi:protein SCO1/2
MEIAESLMGNAVHAFGAAKQLLTDSFDPSFIGLYSDLAGTGKVAKEFRVFYQKASAGSSYTIDHTAYTYVYDALGRLRLTLKHDQPSEKTTEDIRRLLSQTQPD